MNLIFIERSVSFYSVEEVYQNQKKLEAESKQLQAHAGTKQNKSCEFIDCLTCFNIACKNYIC